MGNKIATKTASKAPVTEEQPKAVEPVTPILRSQLENKSRLSSAMQINPTREADSHLHPQGEISVLDLSSSDIVDESSVDEALEVVQENEQENHPPDTVQDKGDETPPDGESTVTDKGAESSDKIPDKFKGKTLEEVISSYQELEKHATKLAQKKQATEQERQEAPVAEEQPIAVPEDLKDLIFSDPDVAVSKIVNLVKGQVTQEVNSKLVESNDIDATSSFLKEKYPDFVNSPGQARLLDGLAQTTEGSSYLERYSKAAEILTKQREEFRKSVLEQEQKTRQETQESRSKASLPNGVRTKGSSGKRYLQSDIDQLILSDPQAYEAVRDDYIKALQEGRVVRNV